MTAGVATAPAGRKYRKVSSGDDCQVNPDKEVLLGRWNVMDVPYCSSNPHWTSLDYYAPKTTDKDMVAGKTCLFFVHGSGWQRGHRKDPMRGGPSLEQHFTPLGFPVVLAGYSLSRSSELANLFLNTLLGGSLVLINSYVTYYFAAIVCSISAILFILSRVNVIAIGGGKRVEIWIIVTGGILIMTWQDVSWIIQAAFAIVTSFLYVELREHFEDKMWCAYPKNVTDVAKAIAYAGRMVDCDDLVLVGYSAGSHLLMHVLLDSNLMEECGVPLEKIKGVVAISGLYDTVLSTWNILMKFIFWVVYGRNAFRGQDSEASVIRLMQSKSSQTFSLPRIRFICGALDFPGIPGDNRLLADMLKENGCDVDLHILPRKTHVNIVSCAKTRELILEFLN